MRMRKQSHEISWHGNEVESKSTMLTLAAIIALDTEAAQAKTTNN